MAYGATTSSSSSETTTKPKTTAKTTVWHTITSGNIVYTTKSIFSQEFKSTYTSAIGSDIKSGQIGLGTLSGNVGGVRTYQESTVSQNNGNMGKSAGVYSLTFGIFVLLNCLL